MEEVVVGRVDGLVVGVGGGMLPGRWLARLQVGLLVYTTDRRGEQSGCV